MPMPAQARAVPDGLSDHRYTLNSSPERPRQSRAQRGEESRRGSGSQSCQELLQRDAVVLARTTNAPEPGRGC